MKNKKVEFQLAKLSDFVNYCMNDLKLNIIGLMCIPPVNEDPT